MRSTFAAATLFLCVVSWTAPAAHAAEEAPAKRKTTQSESYVQIDPIYSSIIDGRTPRGLLLVEIGLDVPEAGMRAQIEHALPLLRDAYVRSLAIYAGTAVRTWKQPDIEDIARRMQAITDHIMGRPGARVLMAQTAIRLSN